MVNATASPGLSEAAKEIAKGAGKGAKALSPLVPAVVMITFLVILLMIVAIIYIWLKKGPRGLIAEVYDPVRREKRAVRLYEVSPGIYATPDGRYIGFISQDAYPVEARLGKFKGRVVPAIKIGQLVYGYDPVKAFYINLIDTGEKVPINKVSDLIYFLYRHQGQKSLKLAPNVELIIQYDGNKIADFIADTMGKDGEESIVSIAGMTGKRKEFEAFVKTLIEMERKQAAALSGAVTKILFAILIVVIIGGIIWAVLSHPGLLSMPKTTTSPHHVTETAKQAAHTVVRTITRTLPRG